MTRRYALLSLILLGSLSACETKDDMSPDALQTPPPDDDDDRRKRRPAPARSGMSSDPDNPAGAPGSRVGTSSTRY
jgi:hypothetical protein